MKSRILPSTEFEKEFMTSILEGNNPISSLVRQGARLMMQKAIEEEVTEFLGRCHYKRRQEGILTGYRNGYETVKFNTGEGQIELKQPQIRQAQENFQSEILKGARRSDALERIIPRLYIKGMSTRDIEDVLRNDLRLDKVSRSVISNLSKQIEEDFNKWRQRDLSKMDILYLFIDGIYVALMQGSDEKEAILVAYGITSSGNKVLVHIEQGSKESYDVCKGFIHNMKARGLNEPLLVIRDGNPGLKKAIKECFPHSFYQHCQVHKLWNILGKMPDSICMQMKGLIHKAFYAGTYAPLLRQ